MHYQPVVDVHDQSIAAVEAVVRWLHPERGLLEPIEFIQVAEETGLIVPLGASCCARPAATSPTGSAVSTASLR